MLHQGEQTLPNELKLLLAVFLLANLVVALWPVTRSPTEADRLLAAHYLPVGVFLHSGYSIAANFSRPNVGFAETTVRTLRRLHVDPEKRRDMIWR